MCVCAWNVRETYVCVCVCVACPPAHASTLCACVLFSLACVCLCVLYCSTGTHWISLWSVARANRMHECNETKMCLFKSLSVSAGPCVFVCVCVWLRKWERWRDHKFVWHPFFAYMHATSVCVFIQAPCLKHFNIKCSLVCIPGILFPASVLAIWW